jgi:hypothetical protein
VKVYTYLNFVGVLLLHGYDVGNSLRVSTRLDESRVKHGLKNRLKIGETNPDWFHQFSVNWPVNLKFFEIKYSKKTRADFNIFWSKQN